MTEINTHPNYDDISSEVQTLAEFSKCDADVIGRSVEDREIHCLTLTDPAAATEDKQRVLIVAGQHGSEESGRAIAMALCEYLLSEDPTACDLLRKLAVAVVPCANPDGSLTNKYRNVDDVNIAHAYSIGRPASSPEGRALESFALSFAPELFVDVHGRAGGGMRGCVWISPPLDFTPDRFFLTELARSAQEAGEAAGYPQAEVKPPGAFPDMTRSDLRLGDRLAAECKTLPLGLETIEKYYTEKEWRESGVARLKRLLEMGTEDYFGLGEPGYPGCLVSGSRIFGLKAHGRTAASRRENRVALVNFVRRNWCIVDRGADGVEGCATIEIRSEGIQGPNPQRFSVLLRTKKPCSIQSITYDGETLVPSDEHGYRIWEDAISVFVQANIMKPFGGPERRLDITYDSPYLKGH